MRRLGKLVGLPLCVLIPATWAVSMFWSVGFDASQRVTAGIESGVLIAHWTAGPATEFGWIFGAAEP